MSSPIQLGAAAVPSLTNRNEKNTEQSRTAKPIPRAPKALPGSVAAFVACGYAAWKL